MVVKITFSCIIGLIALALAAPAFSGQYYLSVAASEGFADSYRAFLTNNGDDTLRIDDFTGTSRGVTSLVLMQQAAALGGFPFVPCIMEAPNPGRAMLLVKQGKAAAFASDMWQGEADDQTIVSAPVVRKGEFEKGIYGLKDNGPLMAVRSLEALRAFSTAVDLTWSRDVAALEAMGIRRIIKVPRFELMFRMIENRRADFILAEFVGNEHVLPLKVFGVELHPVPKVKIGIPFSRHFMFSAKHPMGKRLARAVEAGMKKLRKQGRIRRAYEQCGFIHGAVAGWKLLHPCETSTVDSTTTSR